MTLRSVIIQGDEQFAGAYAYPMPTLDIDLADDEYIVAVNTSSTTAGCRMSHWRLITEVWIAKP